jgi:pyruvate formate-lyase/glycerol dehydratase family glycyl radical enzyme
LRRVNIISDIELSSDDFYDLRSSDIRRSNIRVLKERLLNAPHWICMERAKYYTEIYRRTENFSPSIRMALAFQNTLEKMSINIQKEELLVGNRSSKHIAPPISPERGDFTLVIKYLLPLLKRRHGYRITKEHYEWLVKDIIPFWKNKTIRDMKIDQFKKSNLISKLNLKDKGITRIIRSFGNEGLLKIIKNPSATKMDIAKFFGEFLKNPIQWFEAARFGVSDNLKGRGRCIDTQAHIVIGHKNILKLGFKGIRAKAEKHLLIHKDKRKRDFLSSIIIICDAIKNFSLKYSDLAEKLALNEKDPQRKKELLLISSNTRNVPWNPPQTFFEAIQSLWFVQNAMIISYGAGSGITPGRVDQLLYPFYEEDIRVGRIDREVALHLIEEFIIKINNNVVIWPDIGGVSLNHLGSDIENITIGGIKRNGEDATNKLSYLFIEAIKNTKLATSASFRISNESSQKYKEEVFKIHKYTNSPALFNDEIIIKTLINDGYSIEAARDYCIVGCVEPSGNGDTYGATGGTKLYFPTILDLVFNRGKTTFFGTQDSVDTGDPEKFRSFNDLMNAFNIHLKNIIDVVAEATIIRDNLWMDNFPNPLISCTIDGCIENAMDATEGGSKYKFQAIGGGGLGTVVDSLAAIKKFVFDEKKIEIYELISAIQSNFRNNQQMRQLLKNGPKYGNDNDYVDQIAVDIVNRFCSLVTAKRLPQGGHFKPSLISYGLNVYEGILEPATPNGRMAGEPFSNSISPSNGCEKNGPTAMFNSIAKIDHSKIGYGDSLNVKFPFFDNKNEKELQLFQNLVEVYFEKGGMHVQAVTLSNDVLMDAQKNPEEYKDLVVRVSGYAAYFTRLGKNIQDDIIQRVELNRC